MKINKVSTKLGNGWIFKLFAIYGHSKNLSTKKKKCIPAGGLFSDAFAVFNRDWDFNSAQQQKISRFSSVLFNWAKQAELKLKLFAFWINVMVESHTHTRMSSLTD